VLDTTQAATDTIDYAATDQTGLTVPEKQNPALDATTAAKTHRSKFPFA
jgi:hypothetical protein